MIGSRTHAQSLTTSTCHVEYTGADTHAPTIYPILGSKRGAGETRDWRRRLHTLCVGYASQTATLQQFLCTKSVLEATANTKEAKVNARCSMGDEVVYEAGGSQIHECDMKPRLDAGLVVAANACVC